MHNNIRLVRQERGLSQAELARRIKEKQHIAVTKQSISLYEQGKREPRYEIWNALAAELLVTVSYLKGSSDDQTGFYDLSKATDIPTQKQVQNIINEYQSGKDFSFEQLQEWRKTLVQYKSQIDDYNNVSALIYKRIDDAMGKIDPREQPPLRLKAVMNAVETTIAMFEKHLRDKDLITEYAIMLDGLRSLVFNDDDVTFTDEEFVESITEIVKKLRKTNSKSNAKS